MIKRLLSAILLTAFTFVFAACGNVDDRAAYYSFTDALGRQVTLEEKPERVAALIGSFADMWLLAGGGLCAAADDAWEDFGLTLPGAVNIGGAHSPSLELLLSSDPDFVIASASTASDVELEGALTSAGIDVAYFDVDSFEDYLSVLDLMTDITGNKELYRQNGTDIAEEIEKIKADTAFADIPENRRRILLLRASSGSVKAKGSEGTVLGEMLCDLGLVNIADSQTSLLENLSVEAVIKNEPYRIFVVTMGDSASAKASLEALIKDDPAWSGLDAVREGRLHIMDKTLFNLKPNDRWAEAYGILYEILTDN